MRDRIEPLIAERANWLTETGPGVRLARRCLDRVLSYDAAIDFAARLEPLPASDVMKTVCATLARRVEVIGLENVPAAGPALIVANHPTGIGDGVMLWHALSQVRQDLFFYANADILRVLPQMDDVIAPVEWRQDKRTHAKTRTTMAYTRRAFGEGRLAVIFPSGRLAKRRGLSLHERPWMPSAATLARKFGLQVVPVNIQARNSWIYYLFDLIHPSLRDITLFHETLNKAEQPFRIEVGKALHPDTLPADARAATDILRGATLSLGAPAGQHAGDPRPAQGHGRPRFDHRRV